MKKEVKMVGMYEQDTNILFIGSPELNPDELHDYLSWYSFLELLPKPLRKYMEPGMCFTCKTFPNGKTVTMTGYNCFFPFFFKRKKLEELQNYFEYFLIT